MSFPYSRVLAKLPEENQLFLQYLMPLLHYIACNEEINCMNSVNLAICFAPSLLWPDLGLDVIKNEVPYLVKFLIELSPEIFGQQLPELYHQANLPSSPGVEKVEHMLEQDVQYVPTKVEDGTQFRHKRTNSLETSTSEESGEDEPNSNLKKAQNSGLTVSDSQLSQISQQIEQYTGGRVTEVPGRRRTGAYEDRPSSRRLRKARRPAERSNSYRGPNERQPYSKIRQRPVADVNRRKSIATQTNLPRKPASEYFSQLEALPPSPSSSFSSSSQGFSPQVNPRRPVPIDEANGLYMYLSPQTPPKTKKRRVPQYSQSFSQPYSRGSVHKPLKPIPTSASASFYDKLLPLDADVKVKSQTVNDTDSLSHSQTTTQEEEFPIPAVTWPDASHDNLGEVGGSTPVVDPGLQVGRPLHSQPALSFQSVTSSHSASSSGSQHLPVVPMSVHHPPTYPAQMRPSNISRTSSRSGGSGGSMNRGSPDMLMQLEQTPLSKLNKEFIKVAISKRFDLSSTDISQTPPREAPNASHYSHLSPAIARGPSVHESEHVGVKPTKVAGLDKHQPIVAKFQKFQVRRVGGSSPATTDSSFTKSQSYHSFLSAHRTKDLNVDEVNVDDLPESEQHLNSLPRPSTAEFMRPHKGMMHYPYIPEVVQVAHVESEHDHNKLYPGSGYNSDTESSPSRTLSRPGKLNEVASPTKTIVPHRYRSPMFYPTTDVPRIQPRYYAPRDPTQMKAQDNLKLVQHQYTSDAAAVPDMMSLEPRYDSPVHNEPAQLVQEGASASLLRQNSVSKVVRVGHKENKLDGRDIRNETEKQKNTTPVRRPKSGDSSKVHSSREESSDIESAKVKLGLIPRKRSKSTSENEVMRIIHKVLEEDELEMQQHQSSRPTAEEERAQKHKGWLLSAPTSAERKKAWEQHSRNAPHFQRTDIHSRALREEGRPNIPIKETLQRTSLTPELRRKSSTMPEYFTAVSRTGNRRQLGKGLVRTVKITSSEVPQPRTIRRLNTRTYC